MGQSQSSRESSDDPLTYHPSAIGYSMPSSPSRHLKLFHSNYDENGQRKSTIGPIRNRVKSKQRKPSKGSIEDAMRQDSHACPPEAVPVDVVSNSAGVAAGVGMLEESSGMPMTLPFFPASPSTSNRGEHRISAIPTHPSITEVPEPENVTAAPQIHSIVSGVEPQSPLSQPLAQSQQPEPVSPALADALLAGLGKKYLTVNSPDSADVSLGTSASANVRRAADASYQEKMLAYWGQGMGDLSNVSQRRSERNSSWDSRQGGDETDGSIVGRPSSLYCTAADQWTSQWEDRRGLGISNDTIEEERVLMTSVKKLQSQLEQLSQDIEANLSSSSAKVKRKPVPMVEDWDELDLSTQSSPMEVGKHQRLLWPALVEEDSNEIPSKHNSHLSRASATTEALHSHVEKIRAGPSYQVDPTASSLLLESESNVPAAETVQVSPAGKRTRKFSFMAKIKDRVRKTSDATILSSPTTASPSTPGFGLNTFPLIHTMPASLSLAGQRLNSQISPESEREEKPPTRQTRNIYSLSRKRSQKKESNSALQGEIPITKNAARQAPRRSFASNRSQSSRRSARSINSGRSIRSKRSGTSSPHQVNDRRLSETEKKSIKQRSNSQPLPNQQQWWKGTIAWPRRGSAGLAVTKTDAEGESAWIDEAEGLSPSSSSQRVDLSKAKDSPPLAVIGRTTLPEQEIYQYGQFPSSPSNFSSLAPPPAPGLIPPPRRSRKMAHTDSSSIGEESSSTAASPLPNLGVEGGVQAENGFNGHQSGRISPLSIDVKPRNNVEMQDISLEHDLAASPKSSRVVKSISDVESKEILLSEASSQCHLGHSEGEESLEGDQTDYIATRQVNVDLLSKARQAVSLSPLQSRQGHWQGIEEEDDDGFTVTEPSTTDTMGVRGKRVHSQSHKASMGLPVPVTDSSPYKRPLPAPPVLAEPQADLNTVARSSSTGSTFAAHSSFGAQTSVASMRKHTGVEGDVGGAIMTRLTSQRRPLPPTPSKTANTGHHRSISMPSKPYAPSTQAPQNVLQATDTDRRELQAVPMQRSNVVRESWTSADGPWHADVVALSKMISPARGMAKAIVRPTGQFDRQRVSSSPLDARTQRQDAEWQEQEAVEVVSERVPFAETAVQASLAALEALERSERGDDWQSRWAREKLLGSFAESSKNRLPLPSSQLERSTSEMSDYSNSRSRRRAAPYSRRREDYSSSADEKAKRSGQKKKKSQNSRLMISTSASQIGGQSSVAGGGFTSESDYAHHRRADTGSRLTKSSLRTVIDSSQGGSTWHTKESRSRITRNALPSFSQANTSQITEDWDEKIVPALAKRLELEAAEEADMFMRSRPDVQRQAIVEGSVNNTRKEETPSVLDRSPVKRKADSRRKSTKYARPEDSDDGKSSRSKRTRQRSDKNKKQQSSSRTPKIRKGYGSDDIKAWQASLGVATAPLTLVE